MKVIEKDGQLRHLELTLKECQASLAEETQKRLAAEDEARSYAALFHFISFILQHTDDGISQLLASSQRSLQFVCSVVFSLLLKVID